MVFIYYGIAFILVKTTLMETATYLDQFQKGILYLSYSIVLADGVAHETEEAAMTKIRKAEQISNRIYEQFSHDLQKSSEKEIYKTGIDSLKKCSKDEQVRTFAWIYKIMEADGLVHIKEARFMLYALKSFDVDIDDVISYTSRLPNINAA